MTLTLKHNISGMVSDVNSSAAWGLFSGVNSASDYVLIIGMLLLVFVVLSFTFIRRTQDLGKSFVQSGFIVMLLALPLYYGGVVNGVTVIPDLLMLGIIILEVVGAGLLFFLRYNNSEGGS